MTKEAGALPTDAQLKAFKPLLIEARSEAFLDIARAAKGSYKENPKLDELPKARSKPKIDIIEAFESYCSQPQIKGQLDGPTAKRWRPVVYRFVEWSKHRDLARVTPRETQSSGGTTRTPRVASHLRARTRLCGSRRRRQLPPHMVDALQLELNPFAGIKVKGVKAWKEDDERDSVLSQALTILTATRRRRRI